MNDDKRQLHALPHPTLQILGRRGGRIWGIFAHPPRGQPPQQSAVSGHFGGPKFNRQGQPIAVIRRPMLIFLIDNL